MKIKSNFTFNFHHLRFVFKSFVFLGLTEKYQLIYNVAIFSGIPKKNSVILCRQLTCIELLHRANTRILSQSHPYKWEEFRCSAFTASIKSLNLNSLIGNANHWLIFFCYDIQLDSILYFSAFGYISICKAEVSFK